MAFTSCTQFALLAALVSAAVMGMLVKAETNSVCTQLLGPCNKLNCNEVCRSNHSGGVGICDLEDTCKCHYPCQHPQKTDSSPPAIVTPNALNTTCHAAVGKCDDKCNLVCCLNFCQTVYKGGFGHCNAQQYGGFFICNCDYPC